jgi:hypothetical protein
VAGTVCWIASCRVDREQGILHTSTQEEFIANAAGDLLIAGPMGVAGSQAARATKSVGHTISTFVARYGDEAIAAFRNTNTFQKFAKWSFRENLARQTGFMPTNKFEAHHVLPDNFRLQFERAGFVGDNSIHNPIYGSWVQKDAHRHWSKPYQDRWQRFFQENADPTKNQILDFAKQLSEEFGFNVNFP